ncbi:MAG TPA: chemotaxis protein CheW [Bryobacteraceae bacterium]|nr:chemotaxis protein CheW [Bryobacteraceae bacterium]
MTNARQFCTFYLDHLLFGVESQKIQEVVGYRELRPVPLAPPVVRGLMNLRGQVVVALELRRQLELAERPADMTPVCLVVRAAGGEVCLLADEVGNVVEVDDGSFEPSPETLSRRLRSVILGVHKLEHQLMHVLDTDLACEVKGGCSGSEI